MSTFLVYSQFSFGFQSVKKTKKNTMGVLSILSYAIILIATGIYFFFKRQFRYFEKQGIPHLPPSIPLGNMQNVGRSVHMYERIQELFDKLKKKGSVVGFYNLTDPVYVITDIELIKHVTVKDFNTFINRGDFFNFV